MQCLILAGGLGTRMQKISGQKPKALLPVGSKAFIEWHLRWLKLLGISEVVIAAAFGGELLQRYLAEKEDDLFPRIKFSFDGSVLLGTGGAIKKALPLLKDDFVVTYGDTFLFLSIRDLMETHLKNKKGATLAIFKNQNRGDRSNIIFSEGQIKAYDKFKPVTEMDYIDYGISVVNKDYFSKNVADGPSDYAHFLMASLKQGQLSSFVADHPFQEIGSPAGYKNFCLLMDQNGYFLKQLAESRGLI